jgi:preprotein translocase subunit SecE
VAKSRSARTSTANLEKVSTNPLVQQWRGLRSEISKVTWPTRDEARTLTIAVTIAMIVMALFLYGIDAFFQAVVGGIIRLEIIWVILAVVAVALIGFAFYTNSQED